MSDSRMSTSDSLLRLCDKPIVSNLQGEKTPSVFISYSQGQDDSGAHRTWVAEFARKLSGLGIKVESDMSCDGAKLLPVFMRDGIMNNQYVICVCSDSYVIKSRRPFPRSGVRQEYENILERDSTKQPLEKFVIPIIKDNSIEKFPERVPDKFASLYCWNFESNENPQAEFAHLVERILDIRNLLINITDNRHPDNMYDHCIQKMSDEFYDIAAQYWCSEPDSAEEEKLRMRITTGEFCKFSTEYLPQSVPRIWFDTNLAEKALTTMGRWDSTYTGDQEIFSLLSGGKQQ